MTIDYPKLKTRLPGPKAAKIIKRNKKIISKSYTFAYPLVMERGIGAKVIDVDGNEFLDFTAGIAVCATGHSHPQVVKAVCDQANRFIHMSGTDFYYEEQVLLAEKLSKHAPIKGNKRVFFCNSGAEAVEAAMKLARWHTKRKQFIAFLGAFHGRTMGALSLTGRSAIQKEHFFPLVPGVTHIPYANPYRCPTGSTEKACVEYSLNHLEDIFKRTVPPSEVAGIIVEPVQGEGGYIVPPKEFHRGLKDICEKHGILYIADEVQAGMGRTGKMFASDHFGVKPDIITMAKGIASGMPLGAVISSEKVMNWVPGAHASTFGGNPVSCRAALATIDLLEKKYIANAASQGKYIMTELAKMMKRHKNIGDIRGLGLMIGVEMVKDRTSKDAAPKLRDAIVDEAFKRGLLLLGCGPNSIRFSPPLIISREEAKQALKIYEEAVTASEKKRL